MPGSPPIRRVLVVGITGAGKTTAARRIAELIDAPFHEMDALAIGPGWSTPVGLEADVARIVAEPTWVFDSYGYEQVRDALWAAADTVVWLDYPLRTVLVRVARRSLHRSWHRTPVFGGNVETWRGWLDLDHPVWWALRQHGPRRRDLAARTQRAADHVHTVRLLSTREFDDWLARSTTVEAVHPADIPTVQVAEIPSDAVLLDVRENDEWAAGHIAGAVHVPMNEVPQRIAYDPGALTPEATIVVTCKVGGRSAQVTAWLRQQGYQAVNLEGGMLAWDAAGRPMQADGPGPAQVI